MYMVFVAAYASYRGSCVLVPLLSCFYELGHTYISIIPGVCLPILDI